MSAATIHISPIEVPAGRWRVEVRAAATTIHEVTIPRDYPRKLGVENVAPQRLLETSFRFLLEREPNTSILRAFELPVIARYFPEYVSDVPLRLAR